MVEPWATPASTVLDNTDTVDMATFADDGNTTNGLLTGITTESNVVVRLYDPTTRAVKLSWYWPLLEYMDAHDTVSCAPVSKPIPV